LINEKIALQSHTYYGYPQGICAKRRQIALVATRPYVPPETEFVFGIRFSFKPTEVFELQKQQSHEVVRWKGLLATFRGGAKLNVIRSLEGCKKFVIVLWIDYERRPETVGVKRLGLSFSIV